mgnify:CR=1 FL=1
MNRKRTNANNRRRGKEYERRVAAAVGGKRNLDKSRPHTDVETDTTVYEIKSTISPVPKFLLSAMQQCVLAAKESRYVRRQESSCPSCTWGLACVVHQRVRTLLSPNRRKTREVVR